MTTEREELLTVLAHHRGFLKFTVRNLDDVAARKRTTASELTLAAIVKHVAEVEQTWMRFILEGPQAMALGPDGVAGWLDRWRVREDETLEVLLERYDAVARHTEEIVRALPDLEVSHPLPDAPWFEKGASWSARRVLLHILAETSQHAGHADIIRESLDGQKTMG
jgi:uncharacterized damage-inducible protein DinB